MLGLLTLPILTWLPGAVALRAVFGPRGPIRTDGLAWTFLAVAGSVLLTGWLGFTLAEMGRFSVWLIALLEVLGCAVVLVLHAGARAAVGATARAWLSELGTRLATAVRPAGWRAGGQAPGTRTSRIETVVLVVLLLLGGALFARPAEMLRGALDSGVYVNAGVALARTGSIILTDPLMRELRDDDPVTHKPVDEARQFLQPLNLERYSLNRLRMPGFYMLEKKSGMVLPQHYSLYPVWIAICYQLFGLYGALMATPLLALVACVAVFFFARQVFSTRVALVGLAFLITCPLQIWFARYPVSEIPTEMLAFLFFYTFLRFHDATGRLNALEAAAPGADGAGPATAEWEATRRTARYLGVLAALALGEIALVRPDFPLYLLPVPLYLLWWRLSRTWRPEHTWFVATLGLLLAQWTVHFFFFTFAYTMDLYHNVLLDQRRRWPVLLPLLYLGAGGLLAADRLQSRFPPLLRLLDRGILAGRRRGLLLGALCTLVGAYLAYHYLWEPQILWSATTFDALRRGQIPFAWQAYIGAPLEIIAQTGKSNQTGLSTTNSYILVRIGWYLSPLGILLGAAGLLRALWKRLTPGTAVFFIVLAVVAVLFTADTQTVPTYPYSLRRFLPVVIPGLLVLAAYALGWAAGWLRPRRLARPLAAALAGALVVFFLVTGWVMISHTEEAGAVNELTALANRFPNPKKTILLFSNERDEPYVIATPLQYIFGFNCFSVNLPYGELKGPAVQGAVQRWQKQGYQVYAVLGANGGKLFLPDLAFVPYTAGGPAEWTYNVTELEQLYSQKPKNIAPATLPWGLYALAPRASTPLPDLPFHLDIGGADYPYLAAGFSNKEQTPRSTDANFWRWTGGDAFLRLPWPAAARGAGATLTLRLSAGPAERAIAAPKNPTAAQKAQIVRSPAGLPVIPAPAQVSISASSGLTLGQVTLAPGAPFADFTFPVPANAPTDPAAPGYLLLHLTSSTWAPAEVGVSADARALGVEVDAVTLDRAP